MHASPHNARSKENSESRILIYLRARALVVAPDQCNTPFTVDRAVQSQRNTVSSSTYFPTENNLPCAIRAALYVLVHNIVLPGESYKSFIDKTAAGRGTGAACNHRMRKSYASNATRTLARLTTSALLFTLSASKKTAFSSSIFTPGFGNGKS